MVRLEDVARAAGVSKATASRALAKPEMVTPATRDRVLASCADLGFRPNRVARALTTGRTGLIGLIVPTMANPLFAPLVLAAQEAAETTDEQLVVAISDYDSDREHSLVDRLIREVDGLIMVAPIGPTPALRAVSEKRPLVLVDRVIPGIACVTVDVRAGAQAICDHLTDLGHRHITYVAGPFRTWADTERRRALTGRLRAAHGTLTILGPLPPTFKAGIDVAEKLPRNTSAVVAYNSYLALGLLHALQIHHIRVPANISLVSADDLAALDSTTPSITATRLPLNEVGRQAVEQLHQLLAGRHRRDRHSVPSELIIRESTSASPPPAQK